MKELTIYSLRAVPQDVKPNDVITDDKMDGLGISETHAEKSTVSVDGIYRVPLTLTSIYAGMDDVKEWLLSSGKFSESEFGCWSLQWEYGGGRVAKFGDRTVRIPVEVMKTLKKEHSWDAVCEKVGRTESYELPYGQDGYRVLEPWEGQIINRDSLREIIAVWMDDLNAIDSEDGVQGVFPLAEILVWEFNRAREEGGVIYFSID